MLVFIFKSFVFIYESRSLKSLKSSNSKTTHVKLLREMNHVKKELSCSAPDVCGSGEGYAGWKEYG